MIEYYWKSKEFALKLLIQTLICLILSLSLSVFFFLLFLQKRDWILIEVEHDCYDFVRHLFKKKSEHNINNKCCWAKPKGNVKRELKESVRIWMRVLYAKQYFISFEIFISTALSAHLIHCHICAQLVVRVIHKRCETVSCGITSVWFAWDCIVSQ
jgi:hypothetical protein